MTNSKVAAVGAEYCAAWSTGNVDQAIQHLTDDVEILAPNGTFDGHLGYHEFMDGFAQMLTGVSDFTIYGDEPPPSPGTPPTSNSSPPSPPANASPSSATARRLPFAHPARTRRQSPARGSRS
jgi:hypothetical protein